MASIVLRAMKIGGLEVDDFLSRHPEVRVEKVWRCGEVCAPRRPPMQGSGFNACLADREDDAAALLDAVAALGRLRSAVAQLRALDVRVELDVGLFVGAEFSRNLIFDPAALKFLAEFDVGLEISAYPVTQEAD